MAKDISNTSTSREEPLDGLVETGQWYWVLTDKTEWLGCVMSIGSNFLELQSPRDKSGSTYSSRVHFDDFWQKLRYEPNADAVIANKIAEHQNAVNILLGQIKELSQRLGVVPQTTISDQTGMSETSKSLAVLSTQPDTTAYKKALVKAKEETLPAMFKEVDGHHAALAYWMVAPTLPIEASIRPMKATISAINERIDTIGLYAGLTEEAVKCCDGDPAGMSEKLRIMQRRLYMDEECLLDYAAGGIDIKDITEFDEWLSRPANRDRLLPFPRTIAAFQVRRNAKEREDGGNMWQLMVNIKLKERDSYTFLYVRNGEQVWRIDADLDLGEMIFPDQSEFDPSQPMMIHLHGRSIEKLVPLSEYEVAKAEYDEACVKYDEWEAANPDESDWNNPYRRAKEHSKFDRLWDTWEKFDPSSVYFDDASDRISELVKQYNRIAVIVQGILDRSLVLHPHPPVQMWTTEGMNAAIELIYDSTTLTYGEKPDFNAYRDRLNASINQDSIVTGQEEFWLRDMAKRANEKEREKGGRRMRSNFIRLRPYGDQGPGLVSTITEWKPRAKKAVFRWSILKNQFAPHWGEKSRSTTVHVSKLLNVSAYTPGDYKQFFSDPRTRQEYLKWAPLMLAAEDYHAGKLSLGKPHPNDQSSIYFA